MPRKEAKQVTERPHYLSEDGTLDLSRVFTFQQKQTELLRRAVRKGGKIFIEPVSPQCLSVGGIRGGKLLNVDELIPTPTGWKRNGDIIAGDKIFDDQGKVCNVLVAHPPQYPKVTYKLTFDNGQEVLAGDDHLWCTSTYKQRKNAARRTDEWREKRREARNQDRNYKKIGKNLKYDPVTHSIVTTQEIFDTQQYRGFSNHHVELCGKLELPEKNLLIPPYLLGLWLGDGDKGSGQIYALPEDANEYQKFLPKEVLVTLPSREISHRVVGLTAKLRVLGLLNNKHIPMHYLRSSIKQRTELLQGLMDSDGYAALDGACEFSQSMDHKPIVNGVSELLSSLGIKHTFRPYKKKCTSTGKYGYGLRAQWTSPTPCFRLARKISRQKLVGLDGQSLRHRIVKVEKTKPQLMRCLTVDSPSHLYLCSKSMIPTHNTLGWLMYAVMNYCLAFEKCDILVLRRTFKELDSGAIHDATCGKFIPKEIFTYDSSRHILTFSNGSRIVFGHCEHNKERDLAQYLGQAYPFILIDECGQFSPDAWLRLYTRNTVNAGCVEDKFGNLPIPAMAGCTNPIGPHYEFYRTVFVQKEPWNKPEGAIKNEKDGTWWVVEAGQPRCIYDPREYAYQRTTLLDNQELMIRDPGLLRHLNSLPKAKRDKELLGLDGKFEGQFFDCWSEDYHTINLREDPEAIIWQEYQPVWAGEDWGMGSATSGSANATYIFTKALVRSSAFADTNDYKLKTVCFAEIVLTGGKTYKELASIIAAKCKLPNGNVFKLKSLFFSHEKFARVMDSHSPADDYTRALRELGLPPVTQGTRDRIGSASLMYNMLKNGDLVILDNCKDIIQAIPSLMRDPDELDDVLKVKGSKSDDAYDAFRLGLYGQLSTRRKPTEDDISDHARELIKTDPLKAHFYLLKKAAERANRTVSFKQTELPMWQVKMQRD